MRKKIDTDLLKELRDELDTHSIKKEWVTYKCELVTPMYGGGVKAGEVGTAMPIRVSSIRGQLRFWWRIACGPIDPNELFKQEMAIWGGIGDDGAKASQVEILVKNIESRGEVAAFEYERHHKDRSKFKSVPKPDSNLGHAYALFSAQGKLNKDKTAIEEWPHKIAKPELTFELNVHFKKKGEYDLTPEQVCEVKEAIRWWASFGGVGSRTRRGLGAVRVQAVDEPKITFVSDGEVKAKGGVLTLAFKGESNDPIACWKYGCDKLRDFRQGKNIGRNPPASDSKSPAGQSRWPEADSIRNLANTHSKKHPPNDSKTNFFPRAVFGLPIIFHYQQDRGPGFEPNDHTLRVADTGKERMASPLFIRPYLDVNDKWHSAALLLPNWQEALAQPLELSPKPKNINDQPLHWPSSSEQKKLLSEKDKPMKGRGDDPLSAFLDYFEKGQ